MPKKTSSKKTTTAKARQLHAQLEQDAEREIRVNVNALERELNQNPGGGTPVPAAPVPEAPSEKEPIEYVETIISFVRLRTAPNRASDVVVSLPRETKFVRVADDQHGWTQVRSFDNPKHVGYIQTRHLRKTEG